MTSTDLACPTSGVDWSAGSRGSRAGLSGPGRTLRRGRGDRPYRADAGFLRAAASGSSPGFRANAPNFRSPGGKAGAQAFLFLAVLRLQARLSNRRDPDIQHDVLRVASGQDVLSRWLERTRENAMCNTATMRADEARARAYATPLEDFQPHAVEHFTADTLWPWFERLRAEDHPSTTRRRANTAPIGRSHPLRRHRGL